ncbi:hypothetical protein [Kitasatospora sp. NPDC088134]|uniref:hypothetical protein n=1 Tax=Kitasatospora sp. NPDC088134 TaxID=3364071 RepID=UPI0038150DD7
MTNTAESREALRRVAQSPQAFAGYLANIQSTLLELGNTIEVLAQEQQIVLRGTHVKGDRFYDARLRARATERQIHQLLVALRSAGRAAEVSAYRRQAFEDKVAALPGIREQKALGKANKRNRKQIPVNQMPGQASTSEEKRYDEPASLFDLRDRRAS